MTEFRAYDEFVDFIAAGPSSELVATFQTLCDATTTTGGPERWREVDDLLRVPMMTAATRDRLWKQVVPDATPAPTSG